MRKSKQETAATRARIVAVAATEFRAHGIVATGLSELMSAAGLTHGGFYRHFESKDQLVAEACTQAVETITAQVAARAEQKPGHLGLERAVAGYLSLRHRDAPGEGCPLAALGSEIGRADPATRAAATTGMQKLVEILAAKMPGVPQAEADHRATAAVCTLVGALTLSRIVTDQALSAEILDSARDLIARATK